MSDDAKRAQFIEFGTAFASKAVLTAAIEAINAGSAAQPKVVKRAIKALRHHMPTESPACITCTVDEVDFKLQIFLSLVPRDYRAVVDVPSEEYARDLYLKYNCAKDFSTTYWKHLMRENPGLLVQLKAARADLNWDLHVDPENMTTMFFDELCPMRVGLFCIWVDAEGRPIMKRGAPDVTAIE